VRAVIVESYERIHRSNLVGMGVLPLQFKAGQNAESLGISGREELEIAGLSGEIRPRQDLTVAVRRADGTTASFAVITRLDTPVEINYYRNGGILHTVLRKMLKC
jgi:aconitate hydratase